MENLAGIALALIGLHGLDGQLIWVNPSEIVSMRTPNTNLLHQNIKCTLQTVDGKLINVTDTCDEVRHEIGEVK